MCRNCWTGAGQPRFDSPQLRALAARVGKVDANGVCRPIVADWNLDDQNISYCLTDERITRGDATVIKELLTLPEGERYSVLAMMDGYY